MWASAKPTWSKFFLWGTIIPVNFYVFLASWSRFVVCSCESVPKSHALICLIRWPRCRQSYTCFGFSRHRQHTSVGSRFQASWNFTMQESFFTKSLNSSNDEAAHIIIPPAVAGPDLSLQICPPNSYNQLQQQPPSFPSGLVLASSNTPHEPVRYPDDFKHKMTPQDTLWLGDCRNPQPWVNDAKLAAMPPGTVQLNPFSWNRSLARHAKAGQHEKTHEHIHHGFDLWERQQKSASCNANSDMSDVSSPRKCHDHEASFGTTASRPDLCIANPSLDLQAASDHGMFSLPAEEKTRGVLHNLQSEYVKPIVAGGLYHCLQSSSNSQSLLPNLMHITAGDCTSISSNLQKTTCISHCGFIMSKLPSKRSMRTPRMRWTNSLHQQFVHAVELLGGHERMFFYYQIHPPLCFFLYLWCFFPRICKWRGN